MGADDVADADTSSKAPGRSGDRSRRRGARLALSAPPERVLPDAGTRRPAGPFQSTRQRRVTARSCDGLTPGGSPHLSGKGIGDRYRYPFSDSQPPGIRRRGRRALEGFILTLSPSAAPQEGAAKARRTAPVEHMIVEHVEVDWERFGPAELPVARVDEQGEVEDGVRTLTMERCMHTDCPCGETEFTMMASVEGVEDEPAVWGPLEFCSLGCAKAFLEDDALAILEPKSGKLDDDTAVSPATIVWADTPVVAVVEVDEIPVATYLGRTRKAAEAAVAAGADDRKVGPSLDGETQVRYERL